MDRRPSLALRRAPALVVLLLACVGPRPARPAPAPVAGDEPAHVTESRADVDPVAAAAPTLWGTVVDPGGRPLAGVPVKLYGGFATRWEVASTVTDAEGRYAFDDVEGRGSKIGADGSTYVGVCVGEGLANLNPAAHLPWTDVTIPPGGSLRHDVVLDQGEVARRAAAERARR